MFKSIYEFKDKFKSSENDKFKVKMNEKYLYWINRRIVKNNKNFINDVISVIYKINFLIDEIIIKTILKLSIINLVFLYYFKCKFL